MVNNKNNFGTKSINQKLSQTKEYRDFIKMVTKRMDKGEEEYGKSWLTDDISKEFLEEGADSLNYCFMWWYKNKLISNIIINFRNGKTMPQIARENNINEQWVRDKLKANMLNEEYLNIVRKNTQIFYKNNRKTIEAGAKARRKQYTTTIFKITPSVSYIYGVLLGDGDMQKDTIGLIAIDKEFVQRFRDELYNWCGEKKKINTITNTKYKDCYECCLCSVVISKFFKTMKLEDILNSNKTCKSYFLQGMFDSEGSVCKKTGNVDMFNCNDTIIETCSILLDELNINHSVRTDVKKGTKTNFGKYKEDLKEIKIKAESLSKFNKYIGFTISRKQKRLTWGLNNISRFGSQNHREKISKGKQKIIKNGK